MAERRKEPKNSSGDFIILTIRVVPRSSKVSIEQENATQYKVRLTSPPVNGAANAQLIEVLSKQLCVPQRFIRITRGETSRLKQVQIAGVDRNKVAQLLLAK